MRERRFMTRSGYLECAVGYIAQWLERLTADQQVPGSNPGVPSLHAVRHGLTYPMDLQESWGVGIFVMTSPYGHTGD